MGKHPKVSKMPRRQQKAVMAAITDRQNSRSQRSISLDARRTARNTLDPAIDDIHPWNQAPGRYDVQGVDTKQPKEKEVMAVHPLASPKKADYKPAKKTYKTKKSSDVIGERPTGIVRNHLRNLWGQVHGDEQIGDFDTWLSEQSDKTYGEAKADLLRRGARRQTEMTKGESARHEREKAKREAEMDSQSCDFHIGECDSGDLDDCRIACKECEDDDSCEEEKRLEAVKKRKSSIPEGMVAQKSLTGSGGQMRFKSGEGKKKSKKAAAKNPKKTAKKGSGKLTSFGVKMPGMPTIEDFGG